MYLLYIEQGCPFCARVKSYAKQNDIKLELRDIDVAPYGKELLERGGKKQIPYLVDTKTQTEMYESGDIINYLEAQMAND